MPQPARLLAAICFLLTLSAQISAGSDRDPDASLTPWAVNSEK